MSTGAVGSLPKRLRHAVLHAAGRIVRSGRRLWLRVQQSWPWATAIVRAFRRLRALPVRSAFLSVAGSFSNAWLFYRTPPTGSASWPATTLHRGVLRPTRLPLTALLKDLG